MFELFFPLTLAFLAYVAYDAYRAVLRAERGEPVFKARSSRAQAAPAVTPAAQPAAAPVKAAPETATPPPAAKPAAAEPAPSQPAPAAVEVKLADELRNPATGELSAIPANYRFAKKWIKDALVSEKLLDRVYKPNELDDATTQKAKAAIEKLRAIKKYQA